MTYEIYSISGAPRPWRALLGLVVKNLDFTLHTLEASKKEQKSPAFLALNPRGRTPVLKMGERVLTESLAILSYLDQVHPEPPLFGTTPEEHARIWQLASEGENDLNPACSALTRPIFFHGKDDTDEDVQKGAALARGELRRLDEILAASPFLAGPRITAADCVDFPHVRVIVRATERFPEVMRRLELHPFDAAFPHVARWIARVEALPGYEKTFPAHWRV